MRRPNFGQIVGQTGPRPLRHAVLADMEWFLASKVVAGMEGKTGGACPFGFGNGGGAAAADFTHAAIAPAMSRGALPEFAKEPVEPGQGGLRTGRCLCGAVSFAIRTKADKVFANHDAASRRWTGGIGLTLMVRATNTTFHGWGSIVQFSGSERDRHCFCRLCGTSMFIRHVEPEAMDGMRPCIALNPNERFMK